MMVGRIQRAGLTWLISALLGMAGCLERDGSDGSLTASCPPSMSATGKGVRLSHLKKPSECKFGVVTFCNACIYDAKGGLSHSVSEACGACFETSF